MLFSSQSACRNSFAHIKVKESCSLIDFANISHQFITNMSDFTAGNDIDLPDMSSKQNGVHAVEISRSAAMETRGSVISGQNVVYSVDVRKGACCCGQVTQKEILKGVE